VATLRSRPDIAYLAGELPHRSSNSYEERRAAEYMRDRFLQNTPHVELDEFGSADSFLYVFAACYGEFLIVALVAHWLPKLAFVYGTAVFLAYLAEFTGYRSVSRLFPKYASQNVVARFPSTRPDRLLIVTANTDSASASPLTHPRAQAVVPSLHFGLVLAMLLVIVSCALQIAGESLASPWVSYTRWVSASVLAAAALFLLYCEYVKAPIAGANGNASGLAVLLELARRLRETPVEHSDVWLVATGSKESWMNGMRRFLAQQDLKRRNTYFLNVEHVGQGLLRYVTAEGMLRRFQCSREMTAAAKRQAAHLDAEPLQWGGLPTNGLVALAYGYKAMTITATDSRDHLPDRHWFTDTLERLDHGVIERACAYVEHILRDLDKTGADNA
jgi:hypothetical protein